MRTRLLLLLPLLAACPPAEPDPAGPWNAVADTDLVSPVRAFATLPGGALIAADADGLAQRPLDGAWTRLPNDLPEGAIVWLGEAAGGVLAHVHGAGLHHSTDGAAWSPAAEPLSLPLQGLLNPRGRVVPFGSAVDGDTTWLAGIGGLYRSTDRSTWASVPVATSGALNVLFTDVAAAGDDVWAVAQLADSMLPAEFAGLLSGTVFHSPDGGASWETVDGLPGLAPTAVAMHDGAACVATLDAGVHCFDGGWRAVGPTFDANALASTEHGLWAGSASRGAWLVSDAPSAVGEVGAVGVRGTRALLVDGTEVALRAAPEAPQPHVDQGGTVHLALSFHVNYYHSYRGDSNTDDGYGQDIRVIRDILEWLDEHPEIHGEWDIENQFSLDGWMATESPDILAAIQDRVATGRDDVRLMSWNNGAVANETRDEFDLSIERAIASYDAAFDSQVPGVQPQENMFGPDHIGWYRDHGIDWITLFYAANGFTAMRQEVELRGADLYATHTLRDPDSGAEMTWVPVYHHADVLDHGGLAAWIRQISAQIPGDSLLVVHFDADGESWENFGGELQAIAPLIADGTVVPTNIDPYVAEHPPIQTFDVTGDVADGTGDGFQSWAEKDVNHVVARLINDSRRLADAALLVDPAADVTDSLEARLIALSTTHFGLAAPFLHPDRDAAARQWATDAHDAARDALAAAVGPLEPQEVLVVNALDAAGPALVEVPVVVDEFAGPQALHLFEGDTPIPAAVEVTQPGEPTHAVLRAVLDVQPTSTRTLRWAHDPLTTPATGSLTADDAPTLPALRPAFTECNGVATPHEATEDPADVDPRGVVAELAQPGPAFLCGAEGTLDRRLQRYDGLPGTVVAVDALLPEVGDPTALESVALTPIACEGHATELSWDTFGGTERTRPVRAGSDTWNGQAARSWVALHCEEQTLQVAHRMPDRSSLAFAPLRDRDGRTLIAPLGTLWGDGPWHDPRATGGSGLGEVVTTLVGSQYRPAAPDWAGQAVQYRLLVGEGIDPDVLRLFANPPVVVVP
jgi:hypothetical protein